jgi:hypothetical protein
MSSKMRKNTSLELLKPVLVCSRLTLILPPSSTQIKHLVAIITFLLLAGLDTSYNLYLVTVRYMINPTNLEGDSYIIYLCDCLFNAYIFHTIFLITTSMHKYKKLLAHLGKCECVTQFINCKRVKWKITTFVVAMQCSALFVNFFYYLEVPEYQDLTYFGTFKFIFTLLYETGQVSLDLQFWCILMVIKELYKAVNKSLVAGIYSDLQLSHCRECIGQLHHICEITEDLLGFALFLNLMLHIFFVWWGILLCLSHAFEHLFWTSIATEFGVSNYVSLALDCTYVFLSFWSANGVYSEVCTKRT